MVNSTYRLARANGAGIVLTDGMRRYKVSDWSTGTGDVYGHVEVDGAWTTYQKLPAGLYHDDGRRGGPNRPGPSGNPTGPATEPDSLEEIYARSEHRAPEGSPAEQAILREMEDDEGPEYGESPDPVLRARRRLQGPDGLRDDIHDLIKPLQDQAWLIAQEARHLAARMARVRLRRLEQAFPRHRFTALSAHLTAYCLEISPPLRHFGPHPTEKIDNLVDKSGWLHRPGHPFQDIAQYIHDQSEQISAILTRISDEFSADVGYVTTDEQHDLDTDYGMSPAEATVLRETEDA